MEAYKVTHPLKIDNEGLSFVKSVLKLKTKDFRLLMEAFRRKHFLKSTSGMLGLGTPSSYKSQFFKPNGREIPRALNWYLLSEEGEQMLSLIEDILPVPEDVQERDKANEFLFTY